MKMNWKSLKFLFLFVAPILIVGVFAYLFNFMALINNSADEGSRIIDNDFSGHEKTYGVRVKMANKTLDAMLMLKAEVDFSKAKEMCKKFNMR